MSVTVGPHDFKPLRRWRNHGRCLACYLRETQHPVRGWAPARPMGDKSPANSGGEPGVGETSDRADTQETDG